VPEQKIGLEDALTAYTTGGAYASFEENEKGSLEVGKLADVVILDRDLTTVAPESIRDARINYTIVGGRMVYSRRAESRGTDGGSK
jgi:predicted amidohydrolase YtcJ